MLVDSHCHLDRLDLSNYNGRLEEAIAAARARGVSHMLCVCISDDNREQVIKIANAYEGLYASVGIHPSDVAQAPASIEEIERWAGANKVVALGETGLDYHYSGEKKEVQLQSFANHLTAGVKTGLPVIVHTRDAREDTILMIRKYGSTSTAGVMHCFTESWEMARQALDLGYYISLSGIVTFKNADALREVAKKVPLERLLVETDSPYLAPVPYRGKPNEPKYVCEVATFIAELRGQTFDALAEHTSENFFRLFSRAKK